MHASHVAEKVGRNTAYEALTEAFKIVLRKL